MLSEYLSSVPEIYLFLAISLTAVLIFILIACCIYFAMVAKNALKANDELAKRCEDAEKRADELDRRERLLEIELAEKKTEIGQVDSQMDSLQNIIAAKEQSIESKNHEIVNMTAQLERANASMKLISEENQRMEARVAELFRELKQNLTATAGEMCKNSRDELYKQSRNTMQELVAPVQEKINTFQQYIDSFKTDSNRHNASLITSIDDLRKSQQQLSMEAEKLARTLHYDKKEQGIWGETMLQQILESWGLRENCEYVREYSVSEVVSGTDRRQRPDFVLRLPGERHLIIDAKCPINAYRDYVNAESEEKRQSSLKELVKNIRARIKELADRKYQNITSLSSPDFVFLFIPIEPAYIVSVCEDPDLNNYAYENHIALTTPSTIASALFIARQLWAVQKQTENAEAVKVLLVELCNDLADFANEFRAIGDKLRITQETYDSAKRIMFEKRRGKQSIIAQRENIVSRFGADNECVRLKDEVKGLMTDFEETLSDSSISASNDSSIMQTETKTKPNIH